MDTDLRELERRWRSAGDQESRDALERGWLRAGLGWHGEAPFPGSPVPVADVRGVYRLKDLETQFIYAPGGETECDHLIFGFRGVPRTVPQESCPRCSGTCRRLVRPFFAGRFPVTWDEWSARLIDKKAVDAFTVGGDIPVVSVSLEDVRQFCNDTGLRLLTIVEWNWLAFGGIDQRVCVRCNGSGKAWTPRHAGDHPASEDTSQVYADCPHNGERRKRAYPWGDDEPTVDRCVSRSTDCPAHVLDQSGEPARNAGRSWCGAQDLVGNVSQWVDMPGSSCAIMGGSFRSSDIMSPHHSIAFGPAQPMDHVGFRVAMSIPAVAP